MIASTGAARELRDDSPTKLPVAVLRLRRARSSTPPTAEVPAGASSIEEQAGPHEQGLPSQWQRRRATGHTADPFAVNAEEMKMKALFAALPLAIGLCSAPAQAQDINDVLRQVAPQVFGTQPSQQQQREDDRRTYQRDERQNDLRRGERREDRDTDRRAYQPDDRQNDGRRVGRRDDREDDRYRGRDEREDDRYRGRDTRDEERRIRAREDRLGERQRELDAERRRLSQERYR